MPEIRDRGCAAAVAAPVSATGVGRCFGTFRELIQGAVPGGSVPGGRIADGSVSGGGESGGRSW